MIMNFKEPSNIIIERRKIVDYLLNISHPDGFSKARLFIQYGFHPERWEDFAKSIIAHAQIAEVVFQLETPFGKKIILQGNLETPSKKKLMIKSIWILALESPILVTLYPIRK